ncbi:molybdenum ABC transporter permease [Pedobacter sp. B4-66]|uniref:molybdenum ABC transporter permease n=1 Tax=Pedobacter sp. B4-66 TaxID=2817280 RepID=UPI001BD9C54F|nr:molybdenum ABC transporter permease [Pedobacter sp. B4-66]
MDISNVQVYGTIILIIGLVLRYTMYRRKFNRTNAAGIQQFRNFEHKSVAQPFERFVKIMAMALILFGSFLLIVEWYNHKDDKEKRPMQEATPANPK